MADIALNGRDWMGTDEVARFLGVTAPTVRSWKHRGRGPTCYVIEGSVRYDRADVEAWLKARRQEPAKSA